MIDSFQRAFMKRQTTVRGLRFEQRNWLQTLIVNLTAHPELTVGEALNTVCRLNFAVRFGFGRKLTDAERATVFAQLAKVEAGVKAAVLAIPGKPATQAERIAHVTAALVAFPAS